MSREQETEALLKLAERYIAEGNFQAVMLVLGERANQAHADWRILYLAGQACRFMGELGNACAYLGRAAGTNPDDPSVLLALGIATQLAGDLERSEKALRAAIRCDPSFVLAYNSLGLTFRKQGRYELALKAYEDGLEQLARGVVESMRNSRDSEILRFEETQGKLWSQLAMSAAMWRAVNERADITGLALPTGEMAYHEEMTRGHGGLYFRDTKDDKGALVRLLLPNYLNTFRETLRSEPTYCQMVNNSASALAFLERRDEARARFLESIEFTPLGFAYDAPSRALEALDEEER